MSCRDVGLQKKKKTLNYKTPHTVYDFECIVFTEWLLRMRLLGFGKKKNIDIYIYTCNLHFILFTSYENRQRHERELLIASMKGGEQNAGQEARQQRRAACVR